MYWGIPVTLDERIESIFPEIEDVPEEFLLNSPVSQKEYLINGELRVWEGKTQEVLSPISLVTSSGLSKITIGSYPLLTENESAEALEAAKIAYNNGRGLWPALPVYDRINYIEGFLKRMKSSRKEIVALLMWEIGKPFHEAEKEFDRTVDYITNSIEAMKFLNSTSSQFVIEQGIIGQIRRAPLGVVLCMGPFNYPLNETFTTLIPALLTGNTVIFKPPKIGVLLHYHLLKAFRDSFPPGVVNTVYGEGSQVITPLIVSGEIDMLAYIGSSRVADILKSGHPKPHRFRAVLGLEAKNPAIILPDADLDITIPECIEGCLSFNGQRCTALKILFVHHDIAGRFLEKFSEAIGNVSIGMPWHENVMITPLPETGKTEYLSRLITDARAYGAKILNPCGGKVNHTFMYPALVFPVNKHMRLYSEEQFGPVVPVVPYNDIEIPIHYIVESSYAQQVSIFGNNPDAIGRLLDVLVNQVCRVNINSKCQRGPDIFPFAGRKDSGEGTLSVSDALRAFSVRTIVAATEAAKNKAIFQRIVRERRSNFLSTDVIP